MPAVKLHNDGDRRGGGNALTPAHGGRIGMAAHEPTRSLRHKVETFAALGLSQEGIALACDFSSETLKKYYSEELAAGLARTNSKVGAAIAQSALGERSKCGTCKGSGGTDDEACVDCGGSGEGETWIREPNTTAQIWWSKNRMGWTDRERIEHVGDGGGPVITEQRTSGDTIKARLEAIRQRQSGGTE